MKKITKFLITLTSVGSIVLIATLNGSQLAVVGQPTPEVDGKPPTVPGGPRFIQPREDNLSPGDVPRTTRKAGQCVKGKLNLTALAPENRIGRTVSEYPVFFFYLPQTEGELAEFVLLDQSGNQIYKQDVKISNLSGVIGVSIPANQNVPPLEVGKSYTWKVSVVCDPNDRSGDLLESGVVRRVELSADILRQLDQADPRQKTVIYAENGIWQDALSTLAAARQANLNDTELAADWESLLDSVKLGEIAKEPIVPTQPQP
ncbi:MULTISPECIES: DUF928 domain-containing protein [unclassified Microcoleus]|uniref:DUF928 domain-containing protein n=1 Tax=unclassified Microcoleus TaxID=2642155 RepID=UPI002FCE99D1